MDVNELVTKEDLKRFQLELLTEIKQIVSSTSKSPKEWLRSRDVRKLLGISPGTLQTFRVNGSLPYSKIGGIIFYKYSDITACLERSLSAR